MKQEPHNMIKAQTAPEVDTRSAYTAGLRGLADLLDEHPEIPLPYQGSQPDAAHMTFHFLSCADPKAEMVAALRAFPGPKAKDVNGTYFDVTGNVHGLYYRLTAFRDQVCQRVVTGTREVTSEVPDPAALAALPTTTVTETVEDVEWVCSPLLAETPAAVSA